jgi:hypothetical protein
MCRTGLLLIGCFVGLIDARGDEATNTSVTAKVVQGTVSAAGHKPIDGARIFFTPTLLGGRFAEGAEAKTDAQGHYRIDLGRFPWSKKPLRGLVLAPGFKVGDRIFDVATDMATADFELSPQPWRETAFRVETPAKQPVADSEISCSIGGVLWTKIKTDAEGR